jgi:5'-3' exoribonuclease 2
MCVKVILSDARVPGEGEHKIADFIRRQRAAPTHDPNTVHCVCGTDADLIVLALATHEANCHILREEIVDVVTLDHNRNAADSTVTAKKFVFLRLPVLRQCLEEDLAMPFHYDFERALDDWVCAHSFTLN